MTRARMMMLIAVVGLAVPGAAAAGLAASSAAAQRVPAGMAICPNVHAGTWYAHKKHGNTWIVTVTSPVSCSLAKSVGSKLSYEKTDKFGNFKGVPSRFICGGSPFNAHPTTFLCHDHTDGGSFTYLATGA